MANKPGKRQFGALRKLPSDRWQASYVGPDGFRRVAPNTFPTKGDAQTWLTLREAELLRGEWADPDLGKVQLGTYADRWIAERRISEGTRELYEIVFRLHVRPFLGGKELAKISPDTVRTWRTELLKQGRSADTAAKAYRLLRAILNTAVDDGRIRRNPCRIKGAAVEQPPERSTATIKQVYALAEAIGGRFRVFILAAAFTGLRWGELIALRRMDLDLDGRTIVVQRSIAQRKGGQLAVVPPKWGSGRTVTIPAILVDELRQHLGEYVDEHQASLVFTGPKGATPKRGNWRRSVKWTERVETAGLPEGFHFHDLRHTGNHLASKSGASTRELMHRMGHRTMRAALVYQHATDERAREIADRLGEVVERETTSDDGGEAGERVPDG